MESDEKNQVNPNYMDLNDPFILLFVDFIDGTLSDEKSQEVKHHLDTCVKCRSRMQFMLQSMALTEKMKNGRNEYMESMVDSKREQQIAGIKQRIRLENPIPGEKKENAGNEIRNKRRIAVFTSRRWMLASTAAGIVVLLFVSFLFMNGGNNLFSQFFRNAGTGYILAPATEKGVNDITSSGNHETQRTDLSKSSVIDNSGKATASDTAASYSAGPLFAEDEIKEASSGIVIASDYSRELAAILQGSVSYLVISNNMNSYISIAAYPSAIIQDKEKMLQEIQEKLNSLSLTTKFEFISRENSQKLVEYTSKENATLLRTDAVNKSADFLVISICR